VNVLLCTPDPAAGGGVARSAGRIAETLRGRGWAVTTAHPDREAFAGDIGRSEGGWAFSTPGDLPAWADRLGEAIAALGPEVVVGFYGSTAGIAAVAAAREAGVPVVVALRGNDLDRDFLLSDRHGLVRWAIERADAVCAVSREMARKVAAWTGREATVVGNGVDRARFYPDAAAGEAFRARHGLQGPVAGMFGDLKAKRGVEALGIAARVGYAPLVVGRIRDEVRALVPPETGIVPFTRDDAELRGAYAATDVVLQPSRHDGLPNVVLEAMACGRAVVGRRRGGIPDVIQHGATGWLFDRDEELYGLLRGLRDAPRPDVPARAVAAAPTLQAEGDRWEALLRGTVALVTR
jgi:glycosyltransferase involved in cell wall biosynthesis